LSKDKRPLQAAFRRTLVYAERGWKPPRQTCCTQQRVALRVRGHIADALPSQA